MIILGLDLSYKTGWAVIDGSALVEYGKVLVSDVPQNFSLVFDYYQIDRAHSIANSVASLVRKINPDKIFIEQTNIGKGRIDQKGLEWVHFAVLSELRVDHGHKISYVDTGEWRSKLDIKLSKDQRKHNKAVKAEQARGKVTSKHLAVAKVNSYFGLSLKLKDNDEADAICLAWYGSKVLEAQKVTSTSVDLALRDLI